jgi:predicted helicase
MPRAPRFRWAEYVVDRSLEVAVILIQLRPNECGRTGCFFVYIAIAEAVQRDIICNYKVVVPIVTSEMVTKSRLLNDEVMINGDTIRARQVANQIALQMAVTKHEVSKIITFHRSIASAASFTGPGSEGIHNHLSGFETFHVNGTISTSERESIMDEFRTAPKAVVSNARCLTEGVDLPAVDMVAFFMPKRSHVDIVQAIWQRSCRRPRRHDRCHTL